jgi:hypothetical protein
MARPKSKRERVKCSYIVETLGAVTDGVIGSKEFTAHDQAISLASKIARRPGGYRSRIVKVEVYHTEILAFGARMPS